MLPLVSLTEYSIPFTTEQLVGQARYFIQYNETLSYPKVILESNCSRGEVGQESYEVYPNGWGDGGFVQFA